MPHPVNLLCTNHTRYPHVALVYDRTMRRRITNIFGAIGYLFLLLQWMWALIFGLAPVVTNPAFHDLFLPQGQSTVERPQKQRQPLPGPVQLAILLASIAFSVGIALYAIISVPRAVGRIGQKVTRKAAAKAVPTLTSHKKISKKRQQHLIERITWGIKAAAVILPAIVLAIPPHQSINLDHDASIVFGGLIALLAASSFVVQFLLAKIWRINSRLVW